MWLFPTILSLAVAVPLPQSSIWDLIETWCCFAVKELPQIEMVSFPVCEEGRAEREKVARRQHHDQDGLRGGTTSAHGGHRHHQVGEPLRERNYTTREQAHNKTKHRGNQNGTSVKRIYRQTESIATMPTTPSPCKGALRISNQMGVIMSVPKIDPSFNHLRWGEYQTIEGGALILTFDSFAWGRPRGESLALATKDLNSQLLWAQLLHGCPASPLDWLGAEQANPHSKFRSGQRRECGHSVRGRADTLARWTVIGL